MRIAQLSDTHVVAPGALCHGLDTGSYLAAAVAHLNAMRPAIDHTIVTGDLVDGGRADQYARFAELASGLAMPWSVIPGNHDDVAALRTALPSSRYGEVAGGPVTYALDVGEVRIVGLDANRPGLSPGARFDASSAAWLERTLASSARPTLLAVHHPPFRSGLWYLDAFGFAGVRRLREIVDRHAHVGRVVSGHIHCVRSARWQRAIACSAPSTAPQFVPVFHRLEILMQEPGFAIHDHALGHGWTTTIHRRAAGRYEPAERFVDDGPA